MTGNLASVIVGITHCMPGAPNIYSVGSVLLGIGGLTATGLFPAGNDIGLGIGGMERVAAYTFPIWLIWTGLLLVRTDVRKLNEWSN